MTDLEDLRAQWAEHDRKLEASLRLNRRLLSAVALDRARGPLRRFVRYLAFEVAMGAVALLLLGSFAAAHASEARFLAPAIALGAGVVVLLRAAIRQIMLAARIDHGAPLADAQRRLEELRLESARWIRITFFAAPLAWPPLAIVLLQALLGLDAYVVPGVPWLLANLAFGVAVLAAALWISHRHAARLARSPVLAALARALSDRNLAAAAAHLAEVAAFEDEAR
jgi:hypothetical protein